MQQLRVAARRRYTSEEKVRIVLEGFRREVAVRYLCRREGIKPGAFYAWTKDFMEAGQAGIARKSPPNSAISRYNFGGIIAIF